MDWTPALEAPSKQLLIVPTVDDRDKLAKVVKGIAVLAWCARGVYPVMSPAVRREGRRLFVWHYEEDTVHWVAETFEAIGYDVSVIPWMGSEPMDLPWDQLKVYVRDHMRPWKQEPGYIDILPDIEPPAGDPEVKPEPTPPSARKRAAALKKAEQELAVLAAEQSIDLSDSMRVDDWMQLGLHISNGKPTANVSNVSLLFDAIRDGEIWYDTFLQSIMTYDGDRKTTRRWTDADDIRTTIEIQRRCGVTGAGKQIVSDAVVEFAMRNTRNCLTEYIAGLKWDGYDRIDRAFIDLFGTDDTNYYRQVSRNFFKSLVARAVWPGCKVDTMPVVEGSQGIGKSTVFEKLGGAWYMVMKETPDQKDFYVTMAGKWIIEIAELDSFGRADIKSVKRTLSTAIDRYRMPYGRHAEDHKRQCVFAGTTNRDDWNKDPTGARRFWPVSCRFARPDLAEANRDQYFAEAFHALMHEDKAQWHQFTDYGEVRKQQEARFVDDDWASLIKPRLTGRRLISPASIYSFLDIEAAQWDKAKQMRVAEIMRREGWRSETAWDPDTHSSRRMWVFKADE